jgi:hypothetical protein
MPLKKVLILEGLDGDGVCEEKMFGFYHHKG